MQFTSSDNKFDKISFTPIMSSNKIDTILIKSNSKEFNVSQEAKVPVKTLVELVPEIKSVFKILSEEEREFYHYSPSKIKTDNNGWFQVLGSEKDAYCLQFYSPDTRIETSCVINDEEILHFVEQLETLK